MWNSKWVAIGLLLAGMTVGQTMVVHAENWNRWKGPDQTGISQETDWDTTVLNKSLKVLWKKEVGPGYSNVAIQDNNLYTLGYDEKKKRNNLYCFDAKTGKEEWRYTLKATKGSYEGPKSTPVIDENRVYTTSQDGIVLCNDAKTGKLIWQVDTAKELGNEVLRWRISASILIEGDAAYLNACQSGVALNKKTGAVIWKSAPGEGNYATPISFDVDGKHRLAVFGKHDLHAVDPATGRVAWSYPWKTRYSIIAADPVVIGKTMFISSGYGNGCALIDIAGAQPRQIWRHQDVSTHFGTAVLLDGYLYAIDGNAGTDASLTCLKPEDGSIQWRQEMGFGNMMAAAGHLIYLGENGTVSIVKADPARYQLVSSKSRVIKGTCWTAPVLCNAVLYVRNEKGDLVALSMAK